MDAIAEATHRAAERGPLRLAHRGDHRRHMENSLEALIDAMEIARCDGVEFDVRVSRDGVPVVYHDATLDRLHGRSDAVAERTVAELEELGIPTLEAVVAALPHRAFLDIELKVAIGRSLVEVLAAGRGPHLYRTVISSFDHAALRRVRGMVTGWPCWLNAADLSPATVESAVAIGCRGVSVVAQTIDRRSMARARAAGLEVAAWTVTQRPTYRRLAELGVVAICVEGAALGLGARRGL